ncbi:MAG: hypothetical protein KDD92_10845 [Caldilineaceae bacterium]|nr:hypothetical protein [Caldilineaceae bacterium]
MTADWILDQLSLLSPGFWLALSVVTLPLTYVLGRRVGARLKPWIGVLRWTLIPFAALLSGGLSTRFAGLTKINWAATLNLGVIIFMLTAAVGIAIRIMRMTSEEPRMPPPQQESRLSARRWAYGPLSILWLGAEQLHWCFVRGAIWEMLVTWPTGPVESSAYRTLWLSTLLLLPEIWLQPISFQQRLLKASLLLVTAVTFFYTLNFWLCWAISATLWLLIAGPLPAAPGHSNADSMQQAPALKTERG